MQIGWVVEARDKEWTGGVDEIEVLTIVDWEGEIVWEGKGGGNEIYQIGDEEGLSVGVSE